MKCTKISLALLVLCCNVTQNVQCMENPDLKLNPFVNVNVERLIKESQLLNGTGTRAKIYTNNNYPDKVIKHYENSSGKDCDEAYPARQLMGDDVPKSLMKCYGVLNGNTIIYERINGKTLKEWFYDKKDNEKIPFDFFCQHWVLEMFEGMKYFANHVTFTGTKNFFGGIRYNFINKPCLPNDLNADNIMLRYSNDSKYPTPVKIDHGVFDYFATDTLMNLAGYLKDVMDTKVKYNSDQELKFKQLRSFLALGGKSKSDAPKHWFSANETLKELKKILN